jgi:hypothetical protein
MTFILVIMLIWYRWWWTFLCIDCRRLLCNLMSLNKTKLIQTRILDGHCSHKEPGGHYFSSRESCWNHLSPTSQQSQNAMLG